MYRIPDPSSTILITGAAGFIGSNILAALREGSYKNIIICDRFGSDARWRNLRHHSFQEWVEPEELEFFLETRGDAIDAVIHMGAVSSTTETDVDYIMRNNFQFSQMLFRWCTKVDVPFIYASSAATYGDGAYGYNDDESESYLKKLKPMNAYGFSKHLFDQFVVSEAKAKRAPASWAGLKFFNVYGPNEYHKEGQRSVAVQMFEALSQDKPIQLFKSLHPKFKDGEQLRDFVYVEDCCNVVLWLLKNPKVSGLFNVGAGKARSFLDLAHAVGSAMGIKKPDIQFIPLPENLHKTYQYHTEANLNKLRKAGYKTPSTTLEAGVKAYINFLKTSDPYR